MSLMFDSPFVSYAYSYPHKSAYRPIDPAIALSDVWANQNRDALFLYLHVPFCEFRCGFCNLFTIARPDSDLPRRYLRAMRIQATRTREALADANFARLAIGGGTPTFLGPAEIEELFSIVGDEMGVDAVGIPAGCEASPATVDREKLRLLRQLGIDRLSLGVQSFDEKESRAIGRPQHRGDVERAIGLVKDAGFPVMNLDLIYGGEGQSTASWIRTVKRAIGFRPEEIYLYPLYVRKLTGLGKVSNLTDLSTADRLDWDTQRLAAYREARDLLSSEGYDQVSLRMFRLRSAESMDGPVYCCQTDAMVGLGCGARSYTDKLHYSYEYAVGSREVRRILDDYVSRSGDSFACVDFGFHLKDEDRRRRHLIMSLLQAEGLLCDEYENRFESLPMDDFPGLDELRLAGYLTSDQHRMALTPLGLEYSDAIGPWLNSSRVRQLEATYQWR